MISREGLHPFSFICFGSEPFRPEEQLLSAEGEIFLLTLRNYILLRQTLVVAHINPFQFVLTRRMIGGKYNKWIVILQEFDLEFISVKSKKSLIFVELISDFPSLEEEGVYEDTFVDEHIFLISTLDLWYGDIIVYLQTLKVPTHLSQDSDDDYVM